MIPDLIVGLLVVERQDPVSGALRFHRTAVKAAERVADARTESLGPSPTGGPSEAAWAALRACESGGDYSITSSDGTYRGAYQFDRATWVGVGGPGDPAAASPAEQDRRARLLYAERGADPWPVCGRYLMEG